jgi:hypothetical protein
MSILPRSQHRGYFVQKYQTEYHYVEIGHAIDRRKEFDGAESLTAAVRVYICKLFHVGGG